jgi:integrase/recombinase XerD
MMKSIGKSAGIENVFPHLLRHTFATNLRRRGGDLLLIKEALGHASVSTTEIYAHLGGQEYKGKMRELIN